jgi:hypothetical protein
VKLQIRKEITLFKLRSRRMRMFQNRLLRRTSGPKGMTRQEFGESCIMRNFTTCILSQYNYNDPVKEDEIGRTCSTNGVKRSAYRVLTGSQNGRDH